MRKVKVLLALLLTPLMALAQAVKSPDGNVVLNFSLDNGKPTYELTYKGKAVVKPSHLGLELTRHGNQSGERPPRYATTTTRWPSRLTNRPRSVT